MFSEQESRMIIMALMYFKNDCSVTDIKNLGFDVNDNGVGKCDDMAQALIEDFIGPVWDEEATAKAVDQQQLKLFREES